jgi:hypothetical protein
LFTGLEVRAESPKSLVPDYSVARTVTIDSNLLMPDIAQVFTKTDHLEFSQHESPFSIELIPFMITTCVDYASKHKSRSDVVRRAAEIGIAGLKQKIEMDMLSLLFSAGLESGIMQRPSQFVNYRCPQHIHILSPEIIDSRNNYFPPLQNNFICSHLLGDGQPIQDLAAKQLEQKLYGDLGIRIYPKPDNLILTHLPYLPPLMGINTSFDFDPKTCKVTEKPSRKDGREVMHFAYFCAMGVLDHRSVTLLDLKNI